MNLNTEIIDIDGYKLDIKEMWGVSNDSEDVYLKVDEICSKYGKEIKDFFTKGAKNREIIQELISNRHGINDFSKRRNLLLTELPYMSPNWDEEFSK